MARKNIDTKNQQLLADIPHPQYNIWVNASAGSGKTYQLVERFISLLLNDTPPDKILCLTYTNAAAFEMNERIVKKLVILANLPEPEMREKLKPYFRHRAIGDDDISRAQNLLFNVLDVAGGLHVMTIHAYALSIIRRFPLEAKILPGVQLGSDSQLIQLRAKAFEALSDETVSNLEKYKTSYNAFQHIVQIGKFDKLETLLENMRRKIEGVSDNEVSASLLHLQKYLALEDGLTEAKNWQNYQKQFLTEKDKEFWQKAHDAFAASDKKTDQKFATDMAKLLKYFPSKAALTKVFMTAGKPRKAIGTKQIPEAIRDTLIDNQQDFIRYLEIDKKIQIFNATRSALVLTLSYREFYKTLKTRDGLLDYDDIILKMERLLAHDDEGIAAWVAYKCDGGFQHVLLDEAQDTNPIQWQIIKNICENLFDKGTLFTVGDPKQSIFSFQGADIESFHGSQKYFTDKTAFTDNENSVLKNIPLVESYRSGQEILSLVDDVFVKNPHLMGMNDDWQNHSAIRNSQAYGEIYPCLYYEKGNSNAAREEFALIIAHKIREIIGKAEILPSTEKPVQYRDIMILIKKRDDLPHNIIAALRKFNIPVTGLDKIKLVNDIVYLDIMAMFEFVNLPDNDLNLACLLKTPFINLSEENLLRIATGRGTHESLWHALQQAAKTDKHLLQITSWLKEFLAKADILTPFEFLHFLYYCKAPNHKHTMFALMKARLGEGAVDSLGELLNLAEKYESEENISLYGFMQWTHQSDAEIKREFDNSNHVKICTIHGAKGLQAPIIFMPHLGKTSGGLGEMIYHRDLPEKPLPIWVPYSDMKIDSFENDDEVRKQKESEEGFRLFYVAMTRAEDRLYMMGIEQGKADGVREAEKNLWYDAVYQLFSDNQNGNQNGNQEARQNYRTAPFNMPINASALNIRAAEQQILIFGNDNPVPATDKKMDKVHAPQKITLPEWANEKLPPVIETRQFLTPSKAGAGTGAGGAKSSEPQEKTPLEIDDSSQDDTMIDATLRGILIHKILEYLPRLMRAPNADTAMIATLVEKIYQNHHLPPAQIQTDGKKIIQLYEKYSQFFDGNMQARSEVPIIGQVKYRGQDYHVNGVIDRLIIGKKKILILDYKTGAQGESKRKKYSEAMLVYKLLLENLYPSLAIDAALLWVDSLEFDPIIFPEP